MEAVANLPAVVVTRHQSDGFLGQYLREIDQLTAPFELTTRRTRRTVTPLS